MKSVIDAIVGIFMLLGLGTGIVVLHDAVKKEAMIKVHRGLSPLERYTRKLTRVKLAF